jgi:hypothetical protein
MRPTLIVVVIGFCVLCILGFGYLLSTSRAAAITQATAATVAAEEQRWQAAQITDYQIALDFVTFGANFWVQITVVNGKVVAVDCRDKSTEAGCQYLDPAEYTVPGLFAAARELSTQAERMTATQRADQAAPYGIGFDSSYRFPRYMVWRLSEYTEWRVTSFTVTR